MKINLVFAALSAGFLMATCKPGRIYTIPPVSYPVTEKTAVSDTYFGTVVPDPYRWLEDDTARAVEAWVKAQNRVTFDFLDKIPFRSKVRAKIEELYNYTRVTDPVKAGDYILYFKNDGLQNQPVVYRKKGMQGAEEVFINPNQMSSSGTVAIGLIGVSRDKKYVAYTKSVAGSDWEEILVKEVATGKDLPDHLQHVKFTEASWYGSGFFYSRFPAPEEGKALQAQNRFQRVYYHRVGTAEENDLLIFEDMEHPLRYHNVSLSYDRKFLFLYVAEGTDGFECYYKPVDLKYGGFKALFKGFEHKSTVIEHHNGLFYVLTDIDAPNYRLVAIDPGNPGKENWKEIIPETSHLLENVYSAGGKLVATYLQDVSSHIYLLDFDGGNKTEITLPSIGVAEISYCEADEHELYYSFESYTHPLSLYTYDVQTLQQQVFFTPEIKFDPTSFEVKQVFYLSKDGTKVPMFLVYKKDIVLNGKNPTLLYGYGGFNIHATPDFSASVIALLDYGTIYAEACIRGGSEYGESWHKDGMLLNKQHVFDDFIAAAEYLIREKYTNSSKLGIYGGSNGGLLVGACLNQRPDLFKVAIAAVGVMDMLRYQKFTVGFGWVPEYGSSDDSVQFANLYKYSPLHNLRKGVAYPATLITTGDHDDRVVPAHSFKYATTMQEMQGGKNPVLIRIETQAGHGAGKPISKIIDEAADRWSFFLFNTQTKVE
jgi:prolyl oligopeptidase